MMQVGHHITGELYSTVYFGRDSVMTINEQLVYFQIACLLRATELIEEHTKEGK
jgi:hypothetical protein